MGVSDRAPNYGYGVYGRGGYIGVRGRVYGADSSTYFGVYGTATGSAGQQVGVHGYAGGDSTKYGVAGQAHGPGQNYGVWGHVNGSDDGRAIYGSAADPAGDKAIYAGYFDGDVKIASGLGIGEDVWKPHHQLEVIGDSRASHEPIAYFENTCDTVDGQLVDAYAVQGICANEDWAGYGGRFRGGYIGVWGEVLPTGDKNYLGIRGLAYGGSGDNYGVHGQAGGEGFNVGVRGYSSGIGENVGVSGRAVGGHTNYAIFGSVEHTDTSTNYAGYFKGNTYIRDSLGIGTDSPTQQLEVVGNIEVRDTLDAQVRTWAWNPSKRGLFTAKNNAGNNYVQLGIGGTSYSESHFGVTLNNWGYVYGVNTSGLAIGTVQEYDVLIGTNDTERVRITSSGKVGIGTTSPQAMLDVADTIRAEGLKIEAGASAGHVMTSDGEGNASWQAPTSIGLVPVGAILPWAKSTAGVPALPGEFVECNGQTLSDADSPLNGQSIPDLNGASGTPRFLRGATSSGGTGGNEIHSHLGSAGTSSSTTSVASGVGTQVSSTSHTHNISTTEQSSLPSYYGVVWIMRIK